MASSTAHPATLFDVKIDPEFQNALDYLQANSPQAFEPRGNLDDPVKLRADYRNTVDQLCRPHFAALEGKVNLDIITIPGSTRSVKARIYTRKEDADRPAPVYLLWLHNGGGVEGDLDCEHLVALQHCIRTGHRIVYLEYSKAPEHKFPAGIDDSYETLRWMIDHPEMLNVKKDAPLYLWGSSQGGTLAAALATREAKAGRSNSIKKVLWSHGLADASLVDKTDSWKRTIGRFNALCPEQMRTYVRYYLSDPSQASNPEVAPLQANDVPSNLAPFHFIRCSLDPLDDDAELYEKKLKQAGVSTSQTQLGALPHVFYILGSFFPKAIDRLLDDLEKQTKL